VNGKTCKRCKKARNPAKDLELLRGPESPGIIPHFQSEVGEQGQNLTKQEDI
jgi:hypothetical protein